MKVPFVCLKCCSSFRFFRSFTLKIISIKRMSTKMRKVKMFIWVLSNFTKCIYACIKNKPSSFYSFDCFIHAPKMFITFLFFVTWTSSLPVQVKTVIKKISNLGQILDYQSIKNYYQLRKRKFIWQKTNWKKSNMAQVSAQVSRYLTLIKFGCFFCDASFQYSGQVR